MVFYRKNWRPRRSILFMPASNSRALAKASALDCDGVIFDLEDSVSEQEQDGARDNLRELVQGKDFGNRETIIRVSAAGDDNYSDDIAVAIECKPDAILLPMVDTGRVIYDLAAMLDHSNLDDITIWAMIETPRALVNLREICASNDRLNGLVIGPNDLARETGTANVSGRAPMLPWLMDILAHGRANGLAVLDGVYNNFKDDEGLKAECAQGSAMGFDGKTLIHPAQIEAANAAFSPSSSQIDRAQAIVDLFALPQNKAKNALQLNGEMVERLHLENATNLLALVEKLRK